ncbi:hypothetical protein, partial [Flavonifractor sp. An306]|uniref:hypothetical protein n=1 Tax=Flavonifractor sp. An306 TaxID=1965629 RepID=UPI00194DFE69
ASHGGQLLSLYADKGCHFANGSLALSFYVLRYFTLTNIFFLCSQNWGRKNPETVAASGFFGAISFFGRTMWSVRPIEISPEIPEFMGFARHWPYFFALF